MHNNIVFLYCHDEFNTTHLISWWEGLRYMGGVNSGISGRFDDCPGKDYVL